MYHKWKTKAYKFYLISWLYTKLAPISLELRSKKLYLSICFENGLNRKSKVFFYDFQCSKVEHMEHAILAKYLLFEVKIWKRRSSSRLAPVVWNNSKNKQFYIV